MECNKDEALRAKEIALKKLEEKDFLGARKFALKAQRLYHDMENISQIICVCDVHCAAESNTIGKDLDWYGILQIDQTANEAIIKKQYRKFALLLHPDKNKFSGAENAFKFIGEAQSLLLDKDKRQIYDMKRRTFSKLAPHQLPQQANRNVGVTKTSSRVQTNVSTQFNSNVKATNGKPGGTFNGVGTFWTQCPCCKVRYEYPKEVANRALTCQNCTKPFIAYDMLSSDTRPGSNPTQPVFPGKNIPNAFGSKVGSESQKARQQHKGPNSVNGKVEQESKPSVTVNSKRGKKYEESSESFGSKSSLESEELEINTDLAHGNGDCTTRRSTRNKQKVSYDENFSDEEKVFNPSKKAKDSASNGTTTKVDTSEKRQKPNKEKSNYSNGNETVVESDPKTIPDPEFHEYPDPEFCDFDKLREERCFKVGQVWAAYATVDAMPRFYAKIRKILSPGFNVRITWLEPDPDDELGTVWNEAELPYSCGKFTHGNSENTKDRLMFSHQIVWEKGNGRGSVLIYPRKGETWALFKNWDADWLSISENDRKFEYDYVEILSEYDENTGIHVAQLGKLKGFSCLFCRQNGNEMTILPAEILKFSHRVPSTRMNGDERDGVPKDSFELDPASIV